MSQLTESPQWQALRAHRAAMADTHVRELFAADPRRFENFAVDAGPLTLDFSRHRASVKTRDLLLALAKACEVAAWREKMFAGVPINTTENRAVLHVALRGSGVGCHVNGASDGAVDGASDGAMDSAADGAMDSAADGAMDGEAAAVRNQAREVLDRMGAIARAVRTGQWRGATGQVITDVVHIGIGGSDFGPRLLVDALRAGRPGPRVHFVANVDPDDLDDAIAACSPETTLVVVISKTFTTIETLTNAQAARDWLAQALGPALESHLVAVSNNVAAARAFGVAGINILPMAESVGGRYSVWSAVGLSVMIALGPEAFADLLTGAAAMDRHFLDAPLEANAPVLLALMGIWYTNFWGAQAHGVLPYARRLDFLPDYLQQLEMESNGKRVDRQGNVVDYATAPVLFGNVGANSQHSFHQLLHQGTHLVPIDFVLVDRKHAAQPFERILLASALAQAAALTHGATTPGHPEKDTPGNAPSTTIVLPELTPHSLGALIALYEHKVFVQGIVWNINSFDQMGVELGKGIAKTLLPAFEGGPAPANADSATLGLIRRLA